MLIVPLNGLLTCVAPRCDRRSRRAAWISRRRSHAAIADASSRTDDTGPWLTSLRRRLTDVAARGSRRPFSRRAVEPLGELEDHAFGTADVAEQEGVLVVDDLADRFPAGLSDAVDDATHVVDLEGDVPEAGKVRGRRRLLGAGARRSEAHHLEHVGA